MQRLAGVRLISGLFAADLPMMVSILSIYLEPTDPLVLVWALLSLPSLVCGVGLWLRMSWAREWTMALTLAGALAPLFFVFPHYSYESSSYLFWAFVSPPGWSLLIGGSPFPGFVVAGVLLWYLRRKGTKSYFEG